MKKLLLSVSILAATIVAYGQGQIVSNNGSTTAITNTVTGLRASTATVVGFYINSNTSATEGSPGWALAGGTTNLLSPGVFVGGTRTYAGAPAGTPVAVQVRAWLTAGSFASYEAALAGDPNGLFGTSVVMVITPQVSPTPLPTLASSGLQSIFLVPNIPEPSSIALGLLGLGAIALFRRRK